MNVLRNISIVAIVLLASCVTEAGVSSLRKQELLEAVLNASYGNPSKLKLMPNPEYEKADAPGTLTDYRNWVAHSFSSSAFPFLFKQEGEEVWMTYDPSTAVVERQEIKRVPKKYLVVEFRGFEGDSDLVSIVMYKKGGNDMTWALQVEVDSMVLRIKSLSVG